MPGGSRLGRGRLVRRGEPKRTLSTVRKAQKAAMRTALAPRLKSTIAPRLRRSGQRRFRRPAAPPQRASAGAGSTGFSPARVARAPPRRGGRGPRRRAKRRSGAPSAAACAVAERSGAVQNATHQFRVQRRGPRKRKSLSTRGRHLCRDGMRPRHFRFLPKRFQSPPQTLHRGARRRVGQPRRRGAPRAPPPPNALISRRAAPRAAPVRPGRRPLRARAGWTRRRRNRRGRRPRCAARARRKCRRRLGSPRGMPFGPAPRAALAAPFVGRARATTSVKRRRRTQHRGRQSTARMRRGAWRGAMRPTRPHRSTTRRSSPPAISAAPPPPQTKPKPSGAPTPTA
mmetsp:Transcript_7094/g.24924  ORF Transcript_7094/g.24924 Transcript_7094/m.24924 type:complete len:342 (+) Transcript_7094:185-1210(+)